MTRFEFHSSRNHGLAVSGYTGPEGLPDKPLLTVEVASKWYFLSLILPDGTVREVDFHLLEATAVRMRCSAYCDHVPNPAVVRQFADESAYVLDDIADALITGRWVLEVMS